MKSIFNLWKWLGTLVVHCFTEKHSFSPSNWKISHIGPYWAEKFIFSPLSLEIYILNLLKCIFLENYYMKLFWHILTSRICILTFWALKLHILSILSLKMWFLAQDVHLNQLGYFSSNDLCIMICFSSCFMHHNRNLDF